MSKRRWCLTVGGVLAAIALMGGTAAIILLLKTKEGGLSPPDPTEPLGPSINTTLYNYTAMAIVCDAPTCSEIGRNITQQGGKVADVAIAVLLCMGVIRSQSMGIGGGFVMTYYDKATGKATVLNAREKAPAAATLDMFKGDPMLSQKGGLAVAVPGEMKGYWELYKKHGGGVPWSTLFDPIIELCEEGYAVDSHTKGALDSREADIREEPSMSDIFINPKTNKTYERGEIITRPVLAETFKIIAEDGGDALYNRSHELTQWLVEDLAAFDGIITLDDMENYEVDWLEPIEVPIRGGLKLYSVPPPASGVLEAFMLRILSEFELTPPQTDEEYIKTFHLITEAFKHAYAQRTHLGDPSDPEVKKEIDDLVEKLTKSDTFLNEIKDKINPATTYNDYEYYGAEYYTPEDHGTSHLSIVGANGDAISVTSTVNLYFGAKIRSYRTGIIYNDEMDDFSAPDITNYFGVPPSKNNFIKPGKRPFSSMCPSIFVDSNGDVRLVVGTAGGTKITTATTLVAIRNLWLNENIKDAIDAPRIHHQIYPMQLEYEYRFLLQWREGLELLNHNMTRTMSASSVVNGIARGDDGTLYANWDYRKPGSSAGFNKGEL